MSSDSEVSSAEKRRLHTLTPIAATLPLIPAVLILTFLINGGVLWQTKVGGVTAGLLIVVVVTLVTLGYRYLYWKKFTFWFDPGGDLRIDSGVFFRNERKVALSRLQAVDVARPLIARLVKLAEVRIEVAGAGDKRVKLAYLADPVAEALRAELLARAAQSGDQQVLEPETPEAVIARVPPGQLIGSLMIRTTTVWLLGLSVLIILTTAVSQGPAGLGILIVTGGLPLFMVVGEFLTFYGFTVAKAHDGLRVRHGLLSTQAQTVPHGRVAAFEIIEPLLWRSFGWVRVRITIAGAAGDGEDGSRNSQTVLLPVGTREKALEVLSHVLSGVAVNDVPLTRAPARARWRAPIQSTKLAFGHDDRVFVTQRGLVTRHLSVVAHARTQSVSILQGPYQRALGLSTLRVDVAPGPVRVEGLYFPSTEIASEALAQAQRARTARSGDWASGPVAEPQISAGEERSV